MSALFVVSPAQLAMRSLSMVLSVTHNHSSKLVEWFTSARRMDRTDGGLEKFAPTEANKI